ncbi:MAG: OsmC family protein [Pseudomonadota bacterium]
MSNEQQAAHAHNGVDVDALLAARVAITDAPQAGQFTWKARSTWVDGTHTRIEMDNFFGLGETQGRSRTHVVEADHPEQFSAPDNAATPVEIVLAALAGCLGGGVAAVAQRRDIQLRSVTATVEGDMDMAGVLGIDADVRNGFSDIRITFEIDADASEDEIAALVAQSQKRSAVFDIITNPTNVHATVTKVGGR